MNEFVLRPAKERGEVFEETAERLGIRSAIVEKDFWVCWTLHQLRDVFGDAVSDAAQLDADPNHRPTGLLFKGGTSLSKVYDVIDRFSEDIDLVVDRETLGFTGDRDPDAKMGVNKRDDLLKKLDLACGEYLAQVIVPLLSRQLGHVPDGRPESVEQDPNDPQRITLAFPQSLDPEAYGNAAYVQSKILLEFGAKGELWPARRAFIQPLAAKEFAELFVQSNALVNALDLARTFWEKAIILHGIVMHGLRPGRERLSRHYYDFARIADKAPSVIESTHLLVRAAEYGSRLFQMPRPREVGDVRPGTLRLVPDAPTIQQLERDYASMREMFFDEPPSFEAIVATVQRVEDRVNAVEHSGSTGTAR